MTTEIQRLLHLDAWAVVGLSNNQARAAWDVARFLQSHGKRVVPVHPSSPFVHGEQGDATLAEIPFPIDVAEFFVRSWLVGQLVDEALAIGVKGVWLQVGVVDALAADRARAAGVDVVMDTCPKLEWAASGPR